jgi:hypothetical protein
MGDSFINRKRPAVKDQVEGFLGPACQLDELISGNPLPIAKGSEAEGEKDLDSRFDNKPG